VFVYIYSVNNTCTQNLPYLFEKVSLISCFKDIVWRISLVKHIVNRNKNVTKVRFNIIIYKMMTFKQDIHVFALVSKLLGMFCSTSDFKKVPTFIQSTTCVYVGISYRIILRHNQLFT